MSGSLMNDFVSGMRNITYAATTVGASAADAFMAAPAVAKAGIIASSSSVTLAVSGVTYLIFKGLAALTGSAVVGGCAFVAGTVTVGAFGVAALACTYLFVRAVAAFGD